MKDIAKFKGFGGLTGRMFGSACILAGLTLGTLNAAAPKDFDVIVADSEATIYALNPRTGGRAIITQHDKLNRPYDVACDRTGNVVVSDSGSLRIVGVNLSTGEQTVVAEGGALGVPYGIAMDDQRGRIYVANSSAIVCVNRATGVSETFVAGGVPLDVAVAADGNLYVADAAAGVVRVDRTSKKQTVIAQGGFLQTPTGIAVEGNHTAYVVDGGGRCIVAVDLRTGSQTLVSKEGHLTTPVGIALAGETLVVSDPDAFDFVGGILTIADDGTQQAIGRGEDELVNARGIAIVEALNR
jgi:DNA-binding beta-propeller fold protein YncE